MIEDLSIAQSQAEEDIKNHQALTQEFEQVRNMASRVYAFLTSHQEDRLAANQHYQAAADALDRVGMELAEPRGRSAALLEQVRGAAADLNRSEELAREDIRLAAQAQAEITEAGQAISQARGYSSMGFGVDTSPAESQVIQAQQLLQTQNYEQSIQLAGAAMQSARQIYYAAMQQALMRQMAIGGRATAPGVRMAAPAWNGVSFGAAAATAAAAAILDRSATAASMPSSPTRTRRRLLVQRHRAGELVIRSPSGNGRAASTTILSVSTRLSSMSAVTSGEIDHDPGQESGSPSRRNSTSWPTRSAGYDPIAEMQYEYDRSVEQIKEGREGLAQYRALVERVTRQVDDSRKHVALLEAKIKAYLNAGDRDTAARFALELKRAKDDQAENEKQLALHEQAYQNNLLKIQHAVKKLDDVKHKISKYDAELKMSRAEAEMSALATQFHFNVTTDFGQAEQILQDQIDKNRARVRVAADLSGQGIEEIQREVAVEKAMADDALREFEVSQGLATPETTKASQSTKELGPATQDAGAAAGDLKSSGTGVLPVVWIGFDSSGTAVLPVSRKPDGQTHRAREAGDAHRGGDAESSQ